MDRPPSADARRRLTRDAAAARRQRRSAAARFRPDPVETLLVAEAPPSALDRYFYFDYVPTHDSLFRHVVEGVLGERPTRDKAPYLEELQQRGFFLIDWCEDPFASRREALSGCLPGLIRRARAIRPRRVILISVGSYDIGFEPLHAAGVPVVDARLPFPGSGQQRRFLEGFALALRQWPDPPRR